MSVWMRVTAAARSGKLDNDEGVADRNGDVLGGLVCAYCADTVDIH